jgi:hypothetical protein
MLEFGRILRKQRNDYELPMHIRVNMNHCPIKIPCVINCRQDQKVLLTSIKISALRKPLKQIKSYLRVIQGNHCIAKDLYKSCHIEYSSLQGIRNTDFRYL